MKLSSIVVAVAVGILNAEGARIKTKVELAAQECDEACKTRNQEAAFKVATNRNKTKEIVKEVEDIVARLPSTKFPLGGRTLPIYEAMDTANAAADEAAANLNDPEFQKQMNTIAEKGLADVQAYAESAKKAVVDPRMQKQFKDEALKGLADIEAVLFGTSSFRGALEQVSASLKDPKLRESSDVREAVENLKQAQAAAEQAAADTADCPEIRDMFLEQAAECKKAAANLNDPELQKKMKEIGVFQALATVQADVDNAAKALNDPEVQKQFEQMALKAIADARGVAEQAIAALTDPKFREAALGTLKQVQAQIRNAQRDAEQVAADYAKHPEMQKKSLEHLQKMTDQCEAIQKVIQTAMEKDSKDAKNSFVEVLDPGSPAEGPGAGMSEEEQLRMVEKALEDGVSPAEIVKIMSKEKQDMLANAPDFILNWKSPALVVLKKEILRQRAYGKAEMKADEVTLKKEILRQLARGKADEEEKKDA